MEASKSSVINAKCTKTAAGKLWFINNKSNVSESNIKYSEIVKGEQSLMTVFDDYTGDCI